MAGQGSEWIFISYRRADSRHSARGLYTRLTDTFDKAAVFFDVESIDLGVNFPERLSLAVGRAAVVLAVIGDQWQETLLKKPPKTKRVDYVRAELKLAGERLASGEALLLLPVMIDGGKGFDPDAWPPPLKKDLSALGKANGVTFDDGSWEADYQRLVTKIKAWRAAQPQKAKDKDQRAAEARQVVLQMLGHPALQGLSKHWCPDDAAMQALASRQLRALRKGLQQWAESGQGPASHPLLRPKCMALVTVLSRLAVDAAAAVTALQTLQPLPCSYRGTAALVRAVAQDHALLLLPVVKGFDVRLDRSADASLDLDPGAGLPWVKDLALQFWNAMNPTDVRTDLPESDIKTLAAQIQQLSEDDGIPFLVFCPAGLAKLDVARTKAETLNAKPVVWAEPAAGAPAVLHEPEVDLVAAMRGCIEEIGKL